MSRLEQFAVGAVLFLTPVSLAAPFVLLFYILTK